MNSITLRTDRLVLRPWQDSDREPFAAMNADPRVMEHFPARMTREQSDGMVDHLRRFMAGRGWGLWAVEVPGKHPFIGFVGLSVPSFEAHFTPCTEVGWRLAPFSWGHGYATEAALASLDHAFGPAGLDEVVSFTTLTNKPSQRVMERIGMSHDSTDDFDHPRIADDHPLRRHVLYRITADQHRARK